MRSLSRVSVELTIAANKICANGSNSYEIRNALILEEKKKKIRYKNGETLPNSAQNLLNDAAREARHSRILGNNILRADKNLTRPDDVDAHHVVAVQDERAASARAILFFIWLIGINDAANGLFMRRFPASVVAGLEKSPPHQGIGNIHTDAYHLAVYMRLFRISQKDATTGRAMLRQIASEIVAGTCPH
ncbi:MAG: AHH domain-containing protein [Burkholderiales bacterium]|nr:AHH domain-containing protein [Burkholderiales bacterium]